MESILELLKIIMALFCVGFGVFSVLRPDVVATASSIQADNPRGLAELRIAFGGFFIGMGIGAILLGSVFYSQNIAYQVVGFAWLGGAVIRLLNLVLEDPKDIIDRSFFLLLASEIVPALVLIAPM